MKKERKENSFIKQPYYKGGDKALKEFINTHILYPKISEINKIEGDVQIRYDINHKGDVTDTKIIWGLDDGCNEEAIRVVKLLKFIVPKTPRHLKVTFHKNMRIHFSLNKVHVLPIQSDEVYADQKNAEIKDIQFFYTLKTNETKHPEKVNNKLLSYNYIVKI
ncbi:MAG: TonB family protein [Saprospiraceae bacterium]|nr:TonB family protein [Saprospiraceae bacterium]